MQEITSDMKLAEVLRRWPETAEVFRSRGCQHADTGPMARIMTVRSAARMEGIDLPPLLEALNRVAAQAHTRRDRP